jgi:hypothetical protein
MLCDQICGCAVTSTTLVITGSGTPGDPWVIEQAEFNDITQLQTDVANNTAAIANLPATYVDVTGDSMTGELVISNPGGRQLKLVETTNGTPYLDFRDAAGARVGFVQGRTTTDAIPGLRVGADSGDPFRVYISSVDRVIVDAAQALFYKTAAGIGVQGTEITATGTVIQTRSDSTANLQLNKISTGATASGTVFANFYLSGTAIGSITRNAATSAVLYNVSSDANLKTVIGDLDPELAEYVLALVTPMMYSWNEDPDHTPAIGYIAQQVAQAWPQAVELGFVTPGVGDVADRTWDDDGNETTPEGVWRPWQMDPKVIIPLLHASLVRTTTKLSYLRAEHDELVARVEALELIAKPK